MIYRRKTFSLENKADNPNKSGKKGMLSAYKGLLLTILSGALFSVLGVIVKDMKNLHPGQLALYQYIANLVFSFPELVKCGENVLGPKNLRFLLVIRGILGGTNLFLAFLAYRFLPLGEASVIQYSCPAFVLVAARIVLKEPCGTFQLVTVFVSIIGIIFTTKIPLKVSENPIIYTKESIYGFLAALGALLCSSCRFIVLRKLKSVHQSVILFHLSWVSILETAILTAIIGHFEWHQCSQGLYIIILGCLGFGGQMLMTIATQCELAGPVSTLSAASHIIASFVWQILLYNEMPDLISSIGAVLVGLSVILVAMSKWVSSLPKDATYRQKLAWMLK